MLKHIVLHSPTIDNKGGYHDAGAELAIGDDAAPKVITLARAQELVDGNRAVSRTDAKASEGDTDKSGKK
jgi:hypothetical protein